jgi:hypothetical protein
MYRLPIDPKEDDMVGAHTAVTTQFGAIGLISGATLAAAAAHHLKRATGDQEHGHHLYPGRRRGR